ncbi:DUF6493 family protein [Hymenobacter volaticus]|uniref:DUF6493 family protein n=1 Tax=Hymenobacter volaticus TaxID=2932254 RepID=UPI0024699394|nr:DUF6493 family protein [Hymenobacter volaticus]
MATTAVDTFEHIIRHQNAAELVNFLLELPKTEIVAVRKKAKSLKRELDQFQQLTSGSWGTVGTPEQRMMLQLTALKTYSRREALSPSFQLDQLSKKYTAFFWTVLEHARPDWLGDLFVQASERNPWSRPDYAFLRELENRQLLEYNPRLFATALPGLLHVLATELSDMEPVPVNALEDITQKLQADTVLLTRDLPLIFDFDTNIDGVYAHVQPRMTIRKWKLAAPMNWHTWSEAHPPQVVQWTDILLGLVASTHLDRTDLLTRCLLALRRDFRRPLLTWFKNLFVALKPTKTERLTRQSELMELLAHPLPQVVNFALDQLKDLWTEAGFESAPLLLYAEGLMMRQDLKIALRTLLGTFEKLLKREPALAPTLAQLTSSALANADAAVQERAAKLLAKILGAKKPLLTATKVTEITDSIGLYADLLAAAPRNLLAPFLPAPAPAASADGSATTYAPQPEFMPDISTATAIAPVRDWHDLLFLTAQVLQYDNPTAWERWLDGLLRLRHQFPENYRLQLRPYLQQALPWVLKNKTEEEVTATLLRYDFSTNGNGQRELTQALLISWATGFARQAIPQVSITDHQYSSPDPLLRVEQQRLSAVENQLRTVAKPLPQISTPSHAPYWVAPTVLVQKLLSYQAANQTPDSADLTLALARTAFRAEADAAVARQQLPQLQHAGLRELLQWFLASASEAAPLPPLATNKSLVKVFTERLSRLIPFRPSSAPIPLLEALPWLWAVAARTRHPYAPLEELRPLADYPGLAAPWQPGWGFKQKSHTYWQTWNTERPQVTQLWQELCVPTLHEGEMPPSPLLLYSLHAQLKRKEHYNIWALEPDLPFLLTMLPNNPDPLYWHVLRTACRTDGQEGRAIMQQVLNSLLGAGLCFNETTSALLAIGLTHQAPFAGRLRWKCCCRRCRRAAWCLQFWGRH